MQGALELATLDLFSQDLWTQRSTRKLPVMGFLENRQVEDSYEEEMGVLHKGHVGYAGIAKVIDVS